MSAAEEHLEQLAGAIADGQPIDWRTVEAAGDLSLSQVRALQSLEAMSRGQRAKPSDSLEPGEEPGSVSSGLKSRSLDTTEGPSVSDGIEPGYEILDELGTGAAGGVFRAIDRTLRREVALKVIRSGEGLEERRSQFLREARMLASLEHPNIVRIYSIDEHEGRIRLSLERVQGATLEDFVARSGPFSAHEAARVGIDLCSALAAIHGKGLVHLDLKPANVMRENGGRIVLLDFSVARSQRIEDPRDAQRIGGTPRYMAPEQFRGGEGVSARTDLYALGVLLYWLVSLEHPCDTDQLLVLREKVLRGELTPLLDRRPSIPADFAQIVQRAMATSPDERFDSAGAMAEALLSFVGDRARRGREPSRLHRIEPLPAGEVGPSLLQIRIAADVAVEAMPLESGELRVESRSMDGSERRDVARLALERGPAAFERGPGPVSTLVLPREPTLDDLLAAAILERQVSERELPAGVRAFAQYSAAVREGLRPAPQIPLERCLEGIFAAIRRTAGDDLSDPSVGRRFLGGWRRLEERIFEAARQDLVPHESAICDGPDHARERAFLENDHRLYRQDVMRGERWRVRLPEGPPQGEGLLLDCPKSLLFKYWSRAEGAGRGKGEGVLFLAVNWKDGNWIFSTDPVHRLSLAGLHEELQKAEEEAAAKRGASGGAWFDGEPFAHSLIAAPRGGTALSDETVLSLTRRWAQVAGTRDPLRWLAAVMGRVTGLFKAPRS